MEVTTAHTSGNLKSSREVPPSTEDPSRDDRRAKLLANVTVFGQDKKLSALPVCDLQLSVV